MKRGTLCWIDLSDASSDTSTHKGEFGKIRPAVIISNSEQNLMLPTVVVVPLSSRPPEIWPLRFKIGLIGDKTSYAVIPGIRQVSKLRIRDVIDHALPQTLDRLTEAILLYLQD